MKKKYFLSLLMFLAIINFTLFRAQTCLGIIGGVSPGDDFDGDGICNQNDIDDDNDGVLDVYEITTCSSQLLTPASATSPHYWTTTNSALSQTINETVTLATTFGTDVYGSNQALTSDSWFSGAQNGTGVSYADKPFEATLTYNFSTPINTDRVVLWNPDAANYGGEDNGIKDFSVEVTTQSGQVITFGPYEASLSNAAQTFTFPYSVAKVKIVKLLVTDGWYGNAAPSVSSASASYAAGTLATNYNMTLREFRMGCASVDFDTDGDGFPNRLDLESDGDGCPDAKESRVTGILITGDIINGTPNTTTSTPNAVTQGPYGVNGLANSLENNDTSSATTSYTSTYGNYALNPIINICSDPDGDGITDPTDIDDDNDGILDCTESYTGAIDFGSNAVVTTPTSLYTNSFTKYTGSLDSNSSSVSTFPRQDTTTSATGQLLMQVLAGIGKYVSYDMSMSSLVKLEITYPTAWTGGFYFTNDEIETFSVPNGYMISLTDPDQQLQIYNGTTWQTISGTYIANSITFRMNAGHTFQVGGRINPGEGTFKFTTTTKGFTWVQTNGNVGSNNGCRFQFSTTCEDLDTDGDSISNRLDLDSDNDGCPDVIEGAASIGLSNITNSSMPGGNTTATSGNYFQPITTNVCLTVACGSTGVNSLGLPQFSTPPNGYNNITGQAIGTSQNYSAQDTICLPNPCDITVNNPDSDSDGVSNYCDLDDDNDGILDTSEGCYDTNFAGNDTNPIGIPNVVGISYPFGTSSTGTTYAPTNSLVASIINPTSVTSMSVGSGFSGTLNGSYSLDITGIDATTLQQAVTNNEYLQFSFTTTSGTFGRYLDWFGMYNRVNTNPMYSVTYQISNDGFSSNRTILGSILQVANEGGGTYPVGRRAFNNVNYLLEGSKTYTVRIYIYNVGGPSVNLNFDDSIIVFDYCNLDTDNDLTLDYLDLDSDADGCPDAIEGGDNVTISMLDTSNRIKVAADGVTIPVVVDSQGVPVVVNSGGAAENTTIEQGQSVGTSATTNPLLTAGTTSSNQNINAGQTPAVISLSGSTGSIQWQSSTDNITFTNIVGATSSSYSPGALTITTYYRAILTSAGGCSTNSNVITITIDTVCRNPVTNLDTADPTNHGITLLKRAGSENGNWPMNRNSGFTALESNTKGFVITRVHTADIPLIANPVEGMMIYDLDVHCLKINTTGTTLGWSCFDKAACP